MCTRLLVPAAFPSILTGLKIGWAFAWRTLIAAELVFGASSRSGGLGWFIFENRNQLETASVFAGLLTVILIGLFVESVIFRAIENLTVRSGACKAEARWTGVSLLRKTGRRFAGSCPKWSRPPSTSTILPVTKSASAEARNSAALAMSCELRQPAERHGSDEFLALARRRAEEGRQQRRLGRNRRDGADPDAVRRKLDRERFGQNMHRALGGVIGRQPGPRPQTRGRADIDDDAAARVCGNAAPPPDSRETRP